MDDGNVLFKEESYRIIGACFEVYNVKGYGFLEPVYQDCLQIEFRLQKIPAVPKSAFSLEYKGEPISQHFEPDYICFQEIVLELKAVSQIVDKHRAQVMNYLKASQKRLGILVNFGSHPKLEYERFVAHDEWAPPDLRA